MQFRPEITEVQETGEGAAQESAKLKAALHQARQQIDLLKSQLADASKAQILDAHQELLEDPGLLELATRSVGEGRSAAFAWRAAFTLHASRLDALESPLLRERANDLRDVGRRVLALLAGVKQARIKAPAGSIIIAEALSPSDTASLDRTQVLGFCTTTGGQTGHVAILARSLGIPAVCGIDDAALSLPDGTQVVLDGSKGTLRLDPSAANLAEAAQRMAAQASKRTTELSTASAPAVTLDGQRVEVVANVRTAEETREAVASGGEGVGLLRSEFLFSDRDTAPTEDEQASAYLAVAQALGRERPLVIRTLDVGGDKPLSYLPLPKEDNPFLGLRGVRVSLDHPELFRTQLRAILQAAPICEPARHVPDDRHARRAARRQAAPGGGAARDRAPGQGRRDDRGAGRGGAGGAPGARGGLLLHRHQRPDPVHAGDGPRPPQARQAGRRAEPRRAQADRA